MVILVSVDGPVRQYLTGPFISDERNICADTGSRYTDCIPTYTDVYTEMQADQCLQGYVYQEYQYIIKKKKI